MKKVYMIQANLSYGQALYLPYATGCLAAYAWQFDSIKSEFDKPVFLFQRTAVDEAMKQIKAPAVAAFSCYTWTFEYNKVLAREIKKEYPDCLIVFGGHSISENNRELFSLPFVDIAIYGEGERAFKDILEYVNGSKRIQDIPNIAYRENGQLIANGRIEYQDLDGYLSPYKEGYFDAVVRDNPDTEFCAIVETNRGCPYQCAYCDWCYSDCLRTFPLERVQYDIEWCAKNKIEYVFCSDSNFGILKRDYAIAEYVVALRKKYGYPQIFNTTFAKNSNDTVFAISKMFYDNKLNKAATLAMQTVCDKALENVNRKNFTMEAFSSLIKKYNEYKIPTYTEMILGLPGETYESFCEGLCRLIEAGQQNALTVYYCQVYSNSLMGSKAYREKFGIKIAHVPLNYLHSSIPASEDITEYTDVIVATNDMPFEKMIKSILFCTCLQCFHYIGLLKFFAVYLRKEKNISYHSFYDALLDFVFESKGGFINSVFGKIRKDCSDFSNGEWSYYNPKFGEIGWFLEEGAFMELISDFERLWDELEPFLRSFHLPEDIFRELIKYQKFVIRLPQQVSLECTFHYDFYHYFYNAIADQYSPLKKINNTIKIKIPNPVNNWKDYARQVMLFAKRRGDTIVVSDSRNITIEYGSTES